MRKKLRKNKKKAEKKKPKFDVHSDAIKSLWGISFLVFFFLSVLSFAGMAGSVGEWFAGISKMILGWGAFIIPVMLLAGAYILFSSWKRNTYFPIVIGGILFFSGILGILNFFSDSEMMGGYWGFILAMPLIRAFGNFASFIIFVGLIAASIIIVFNIKIGKIFENRKERLRALKDSIVESKSQITANLAQAPVAEFKVKTWKDDDGRETGEEQDPSLPKDLEGNSAEQAQKGSVSVQREIPRQLSEDTENEKGFKIKNSPIIDSSFRMPPIELLEKETGRPSSGDIVANANIIKRTFQNFGIEVDMGEVNVGPTVTQFTLKPAEGVKLARILALNNDLSLALASHPIRIEAPIPGKSLVGVEIPNKGFTIVRLKNLIESKDFQERSNNLTLCFGRDVSGAGVYANLSSMPHLLIAGSTGSGKTICLNIIICSLLYQNPPNLLKFILIDPKRVEFPVYSDIPHLLAPIVVDTQKSVGALKWAVSEMERRFEVLSRARVRDIQSFNSNKKVVQEQGPLPYIVLVIDELADLMASRGKDIEALIVRLAQMSRAVGIHLILATQRPSVEVITGLIKANITSRIAFQVASQVDSRTILDMAGAEKLLGNGDMLYLAGDASKPKRVQGAYITEKEIRRVTDYLREEGEKIRSADGDSLDEEINFQDASKEKLPLDGKVDFDDVGAASDDELYEEAKEVVIQSQKASSSLLQRRLRIGYARAARLVDMLEENGIVGPGDGAKPREVYVAREEEV